MRKTIGIKIVGTNKTIRTKGLVKLTPTKKKNESEKLE